MPKAKYEDIYRDIKHDIDSGKYQVGEYLPSENVYTRKYGCTRNTVRRALAMLSDQGYVIPQHGKGTQVIMTPQNNRSVFTIGGIESFAEVVDRTGAKIQTDVIDFKEITCDHQLSNQTGFDEGSELYYIERVRILDGRRFIFDTNIFLKSETEGLNREIAGRSIYNYLENDLGMTITTSRRFVTAQRAEARDRELLDLRDYDFVLVVSGQVFNSRGVMFECTQSRHCPDMACFAETAVRRRV